MSDTCPWSLASLLDVEALRALGVVPHYFGLGFIQIKLDEHWRLHAWVPDWPVIPGAESELHDHRYPFVSQVLQGALEHRLVIPGPIHEWPAPGDLELVQVSCQPDQTAPPVRIGYAAPQPLAQFLALAGTRYELHPDVFHVATPVGPTLTLVRREAPQRPFARVLRPTGTASVCPFTLNPGADACWDRLATLLVEGQARETPAA